MELTSLVGRRAELAEVRKLLAASRLVTLAGPGGVGKTRLALRTGRTSRAAFPDGVWFVPLADVTEGDLLGSVVMSAMTNPRRAGAGPIEVADHIGDRQVLLILDNCEHLVDVCAKLAAELLLRCPNLRLLATSREPLRIPGEARFAVPPLSLPELGRPLSPGSGGRFDAVALFRDRAAALNPDFSLDDTNEDAVIALCRRLDGLPLAIELAATGTRLLSIADLARWAVDPSSAPVFGDRTAPSRQQTLHATINHSYDLCSIDGQMLWARMSVFRGGADLDAVRAVCAGDGLVPAKVLPVLLELVDKSIVVFDGSRYEMLDTIREFGSERLRAMGERETVRRRHRDHFAELTAEVDAGWFGPDQLALFGRVLRDMPNMRAAFEFCLADRAEAGVGVRMALVLVEFWNATGLPGEGKRWLDRLLAVDDEQNAERAAALEAAGFLASMAGDIPAARVFLEQCLQLADRFENHASRAHAMGYRGVIEHIEGDIEKAVADLEESLRLERNLSEFDPVLATLLVCLGAAALCDADRLDRAVEVLEEARTLCAAHGEQFLQSWALLYLGLAALIDGRVSEAVELVKDALIRKRALEDKIGIAFAVEFLAWAAVADRDAGRAARLLAASEALAKQIGPLLLGFRNLLESRDRYLAQAREALGTRGFDEAVQFGRQLPPDDIVAVALEERTSAPTTATDNATLPLTPRELEIAQLVATGKTNREIAADLVIAHRTVDTHVEHILTKLNFTSRTQIAVLFATMAKAAE